MTTPHQAFQEATERAESIARRRGLLVPFAAAIIAVLASLGTLFSHHRSISALAFKNEAILTQSKASDQFAYYQAKRIKFTIYSALVSAGVPKDAAAAKALKNVADHEATTSLAVLSSAQALEKQAIEDQERSEGTLKSFETLEIGTTLFDIAIVFVSISALSQTRPLLYLGCAMSVVGIAYTAIGYFQIH